MVLNDVVMRSPIKINPVPSPNISEFTVRVDMNPVDETNSDVALKLDILTLRDVKTWLIPCMDDLSCALEIYPIEPRACSELKSVADEMKVDGTDERYPIEPKPTKELVSCGVEMMLDKDKEDK